MNVKPTSLRVFVYFIQFLVLGYASEYRVIFTSNAPAIIGSTVTYTAELFQRNERPSGKFQYHFYDDFHPENSFRNETTSTTVTWNVTYTGKEKVGNYTAKVIVKGSIIFGSFFTEICRNATRLSLTSALNGNVDLAQNGTLRQKYVSTAIAVVHNVSLTTPDYNFITKKATSILTFWFIDCIYRGITKDLQPFSFNYTQIDKWHQVESLTVADFTPLPPTTVAPPTTTTTTPAPTSSTITPSTTTTTTTTTTIAPTTTTSTTEKPTSLKIVHNVKKRSSDDTSESPEPTAINHVGSYVAGNSSSGVNRTILEINTNEITEVTHSTPSPTDHTDDKSQITSIIPSTAVPSKANDSTHTLPEIYAELKHYFPNVNITNSCVKPSDFIIGLNETYAYTSQNFKAVAPVSSIEVNGAKWLQEEEVLNITVQCNGSAVLKYCVQIVNGLYNVTGHESCSILKTLQNCHFSFTHWFGENPSSVHTLLIILENEVSKIVKPVAINMYHAVKQTQLSVIVVPVVASAVAVILIVFGIASYIQSKNRYQIEVADFDFSHASDMEYKTFRERLREAILSAINRTQDFSDQDSSTSSWPPPPSRKYGSMPEPENPS